MSLLSRFVDTAFTKINTERLPTGMGGGFLAQGAAQPAGQLAQLNAMASVGWLFAVVNRIAQSIAAQDWKLYRVQRGDRVEVDTHPALDLWRSANPFITREDFLETSQQHMELVGEMWWVLVRNGAGIPVELQVIRPDRMKPIPHPTDFIAGYEYRIGSNGMFLEKDDVIYTRNPNPLDAYRGIGVVQSMMVDLGAERLAAEWMANFFRNSAEPGGIIEFPQNLQDADFQRLAERWRFQHQGVANAHRVAILERGTWKDRKLTQRDMQFEQLRRFERDQILGAFGMPLPIMGITESVNRANAEAAEVMYARWLIRPRLRRIKAALNEKLLKLYPDGDTLEFDFIDPVPDNRMELINEGTLGYEKKILTLNEARRRFGEDDWDGPEGDALHTPPAPPPMLAPPAPEDPSEEEPEEEPEEEEEQEEQAGYKPRRPRRSKVEANDEYPDEGNLVANRIERGWKRRFGLELRLLIAYLEKNDKALMAPNTKLTPGIADGFDWDWWAKYGDEVVEELAESFALVLAAEMPRASLPEVQRLASLYAETRGAELLRVDGPANMVNLTRTRVNALVASTVRDGESLRTLSKNLRQDLAFSPSRARTVARTETATALGQGQKTAAKADGRSEKRWVTQGDGLVNPEICAANADQDWIGIGDTFQSGHDTIPGHVNCRCVVIFRNTPISEQEASTEERLFQSEVRCPQCNRKSGENIAVGTNLRCRRCKHEWEVTHDGHDSKVTAR
jgi:HK97 family phage portal protein